MRILKASFFLLLLTYINIAQSTYREQFEEETTEKSIKISPWTTGEKVLIGTAVGGTILIAGAAGYIFISDIMLQNDINQTLDFQRNNITALTQEALDHANHLSDLSIKLVQNAIDLEGLLNSGYEILNDRLIKIDNLSMSINEAVLNHIQSLIETTDIYFKDASSQMFNFSETINNNFISIESFSENFSLLNNQIKNLTLSTWDGLVHSYQSLCKSYVPAGRNGCDFIRPFSPYGSRCYRLGNFPAFNSTDPECYDH